MLVPFLGLAQQLGRLGGAGAGHLVLEGEEGAALVAVGLDRGAQPLDGLAELCVPLGLRLSPFNDELGEVLIVALDLPGLLRDLCREARDGRLLFELGGDAV